MTGSATGTVQLSRIGSGSARPLVISRPSPTTIAFLPGSPSRLLSLESTRARVLDVTSGREIAGGFSYPVHFNPQTWTMVHPPIRADMKFVVVPTGQLQAWELGAGGVTHVAKLEGSPTKPRRAWFSPSGDLVASFFSLQQLGVWNLRTGRLAGPLFNAQNNVRATAFSPDGQRIAVGTQDGACMIIDVATALPTVKIATRAMVRVFAVAFSPDGLRLITVNDASETRIWNASTGDLIGTVGDASLQNPGVVAILARRAVVRHLGLALYAAVERQNGPCRRSSDTGMGKPGAVQ